MANVSVSVSDDLKRKMDGLKIINWSEVARQAFDQKIHDIELLNHMASKSRLTEADALQLGRKVSAGLSSRLRAYAASQNKK
jgi:hypothetical protein